MLEQKRSTINKIGDVIIAAVRIILLFVCMVCISAAMIGTVFVFLDIKWGIIAILLTFVFSGVFVYFMMKRDFLYFDSIKELIVFLIIESILFAIYVKYAPVLEIGQDQGLYMFKAMNLVNYGFTYKPLNFLEELISNGVIENINSGYAILQNGTVYSDGMLQSDFFPAGAFVYAIVGKISKEHIFLGQTVLMMLAGALFFFALKGILKKNFNCSISAIYIVSFFVSPVIVFFGRSSFSENIALVLILFLINILNEEHPNMFFVIFGMLSLYSARMDFMLLSIAGILIVALFSRKLSVVYSLLLLCVFYLFNNSYSIYSQRIMRNDLQILKYTAIMIMIVLIISIVVCNKNSFIVSKIYHSQVTKIIYSIFCVVAIFMMFRDNVGYYTGYDMEYMYEQHLMTYVEFVLDLLFLAFPSLLIVGGIFALPDFLGNKDRSMMQNIFIIVTMTIYMMFLFTVGQAPQLYWFLRRYIYAVLPIATISFVVLMSKYDNKINYIIATFVLLMSINLNLNSHNGVEYKNLDKDVIEISKVWENEGVDIVIYDSQLRLKVSPLLSYLDIQVIPIDKENMEEVCEYIIRQEYDLSKIKILLTEGEGTLRELKYQRHEEVMGELPNQLHTIYVSMYEYSVMEFLETVR